jgi:hypothetical protein
MLKITTIFTKITISFLGEKSVYDVSIEDTSYTDFCLAAKQAAA